MRTRVLLMLLFTISHVTLTPNYFPSPSSTRAPGDGAALARSHRLIQLVSTTMAFDKKRGAPSNGPGGPAKKGKFESKGGKPGAGTKDHARSKFTKPAQGKAQASKAPRSAAPRGGRAARGEKEEEVRRRKMPLTAVAGQDEAGSDDDDVDMEDLEDEEVDAMEVDGAEAPAEAAEAPSGAEQKRLSKGKFPPDITSPAICSSQRQSRNTPQPRKQLSTPPNRTERPCFPPTPFSATPCYPSGRKRARPSSAKTSARRPSPSCGLR